MLIRLCTLWFGLGLGVIALLIFRSVSPPGFLAQHADFSTERIDDWQEEKRKIDTNSALPGNEAQRGLQPASTPARRGDKAV